MRIGVSAAGPGVAFIGVHGTSDPDAARRGNAPPRAEWDRSTGAVRRLTSDDKHDSVTHHAEDDPESRCPDPARPQAAAEAGGEAARAARLRPGRPGCRTRPQPVANRSWGCVAFATPRTAGGPRRQGGGPRASGS